ncbi:MAG: PIN domain-containing protein [Phycisphaerae bacterium]|nr:PIN domain-containing protein [Phycisphaerae bacterium]
MALWPRSFHPDHQKPTTASPATSRRPLPPDGPKSSPHGAEKLRLENVKTPDAIHAATAMECGADLVLTGDRDMLRVKELKVELV